MKPLSKIGLLFLPDQLILFPFLVSGILLIFSAPLMLLIEPRFFIVVFFIMLPWMLAWLHYGYNFISISTYRIEISLLLIISLLGLSNILYSDDLYRSLLSMKLFLLSGIFPFWTSIFIFRNHWNRNAFYYFAWACLLVVTIIEIGSKVHTGSCVVISHCIPIGTLIILLSIGPLKYLPSKTITRKIALGSLCLGLILIIILGKRGTLLAVGGMAFTWFFCHYRKSLYSIIGIMILILLIIMGSMKYQSLDSNIPYHNSILHRIELYSFAWEVFKKKPIGGIGIRAYSHGRYLADYQQKNKDLADFPSVAKDLQTFDNMLVTGLVEFGTLMTLAYLTLVFYYSEHLTD
jgi:hypothetical protein